MRSDTACISRLAKDVIPEADDQNEEVEEDQGGDVDVDEDVHCGDGLTEST